MRASTQDAYSTTDTGSFEATTDIRRGLHTLRIVYITLLLVMIIFSVLLIVPPWSAPRFRGVNSRLLLFTVIWLCPAISTLFLGFFAAGLRYVLGYSWRSIAACLAIIVCIPVVSLALVAILDRRLYTAERNGVYRPQASRVSHSLLRTRYLRTVVTLSPLVVLAWITAVLVPACGGIFAGINVALPWVTRLVLSVSDNSYLAWGIRGVVIGIIGFVLALKEFTIESVTIKKRINLCCFLFILIICLISVIACFAPIFTLQDYIK